MVTWVHKRCGVYLAGAVLFPLCLLQAALEPLERSFTVHRWTSDDGLPGNSVQDLGVGPDGLLWGVSGSEIWRFDGARFVTTPAALAAINDGERMIESLVITRGNGVHIQLVLGKDLLFKNGKWGQDTADRSLLGGKRMFFDTSVGAWNLVRTGLMLRTGKETRFYAGPETILKGRGLFTWAAPDLSGSNVWVTATTGLFRFSERQFNEVVVTKAVGEANFERICVGASGQVWLYGHPDRFYVLRDGVWEQVPKPAGEWPMRMGAEVMVERNGRELWVGTSEGLFRWDGCAWGRLEPGGLAPAGVIALHVGREGEVWVGLEGGGLLCLRERRITMVRAPDGPAVQAFSAVYESRGGLLYAGIANAGLWSGPLERLQRVPVPNLYNKTTVLAIAEDAKGGLLIGPTGGSLLCYRDGAAKMIYPGAESPWMDFGIRSILAGPSGRLWVGTQRGLMVETENEKELRLFPGPARSAVNALARTADGVLWVASDRYGVIAVAPEGLDTFITRPERMKPFADVRALLVDSRGRLWAGGPSGLAYRDAGGVWKLFDTQRLGTVVQIHEDVSGALWIGSLKGIARIASPATLGKVNWYGREDGLDSEACSGGFGNAGCRLRDGRLLFPTQDGLAVVDPRRLTPTYTPVAPLLDEVLADGRAVWQNNPFDRQPSGAPVLTVPAGTRVVTVHYLASNFTEGRTVLFRHRLGDESAKWSTWTTSREAVLEKLSPASYPFSLQAMTRDGQVADLGQTPVIRMPPLWWQRQSVQATGIAGLLLVLGTGVWRLGRRRLRRRLAQVERERTIEAERSRISRELHDDVGASLTQIAMMSQGLKQNIGSAEGVGAEQLEKIFQKARGVTRALDEIVWSLNPKHDRLENTLVYFASYAREFLSLADIRCRIHLPDADMERVVPSTIRHHLYLALKESLHNIVKHAEAREVWIRVALEGTRLVMEISDDGKGLKHAGKVAADADGQSNLTWRMAQIGGVCRQLTSEQGGLKTVLSVPLGIEKVEV